MKLITEKLVVDVEEKKKGEFLLTLESCTCEDQSEPWLFTCEETGIQHGCFHKQAGPLKLHELDVKIGRQFHIQVATFMGIPFQVELGPDEMCCTKNSNKIVEIIP